MVDTRMMIAEGTRIVPFLTSSVRQKPPLSSAPVSRPTRLRTPACARDLVALGIGGLGLLGCSLPGIWEFHTVALGVGAKEKLAKDLGRTSTSTLRDDAQRPCVWAGQRILRTRQWCGWGHCV